LELEHALSHENELPQLTPEQSPQLALVSQFELSSLLHESLQLTSVERGGSTGSTPPSRPGNVPPVPKISARQPSSAALHTLSSMKRALFSSWSSEFAASGSRGHPDAARPVQPFTDVIASERFAHRRK
jgi:hypothetical protein